MKIRYGWWVDAPCWFILLITGHDDGMTLVGVVYLNGSQYFVEEDEGQYHPTPPSAIVGGVVNFFGARPYK